MERMPEHRPTRVIVDLDAIHHNLRVLQAKLYPGQMIYAVVKANAYGHGAFEVAQTALAGGATGLAVATADEGIQLRQQGITAPILVLGLTNPEGIEALLTYHLSVTVSSLTFFERAKAYMQSRGQGERLDRTSLPFHLALDTGMSRIGLQSEREIHAFIEGIQAYPWADWQGVFTHFSTIGGGPQAYVEVQWAKWQAWMPLIPEWVKIRHYANSAMGMWGDKVPPSDIVRYGIGLYGLDPKDQWPGPDPLQPALSLVSALVYTKEIPAGQSVSYGATYTAQEPEWIGTVPIGYADGWFRHYSTIPVLIDGQACPVVGVINMDQLMIKLPAYYPPGTPITLIGKNGGLENHLSPMARTLHTISYEILCGISSRVPRYYVKGDSHA